MRMVELVEDDVVGQVDGDGVGMEQRDEDGEGVVVEQGDEDDVEVVEGQGDDEVGVVVGLGKGKEDTSVWGGFLGSEWPSGVVGGVSRIRSAGWSGYWRLYSENPSQSQPRTWGGDWRMEGGGRWLMSVGGTGWGGAETQEFRRLPFLLFGFLGLDFGSVVVVGGGGLRSFSSFFFRTSSPGLLHSSSGFPLSSPWSVEWGERVCRVDHLSLLLSGE